MPDEPEASNHSQEKFMPSNHKKILAALLGVVVVVAAGFTVMNMDNSATTQPDDNTEADNSSTDDTNEQVGLSESQIAGDVADVTLTSLQAEPERVEITTEDGVRFSNEAGADLEVAFDRELPNLQLAAGESTIVAPDSIVYYNATAQDSDASFRGISGAMIYVEP